MQLQTYTLSRGEVERELLHTPGEEDGSTVQMSYDIRPHKMAAAFPWKQLYIDNMQNSERQSKNNTQF